MTTRPRTPVAINSFAKTFNHHMRHSNLNLGGCNSTTQKKTSNQNNQNNPILCSFGLFLLFGLCWIWFFGLWDVVFQVMGFCCSGCGHWFPGYGFGYLDLAVIVIWLFGLIQISGFAYSGSSGYSAFRDLVFRVYGAHKPGKPEKTKYPEKPRKPKKPGKPE